MGDNFARKIWYGVGLFLLIVIQAFLLFLDSKFHEQLACIISYGMILAGVLLVYVGVRFLIILFMDKSGFLTDVDTWLSRIVHVILKVLIFLRIGYWFKS